MIVCTSGTVVFWMRSDSRHMGEAEAGERPTPAATTHATVNLEIDVMTYSLSCPLLWKSSRNPPARSTVSTLDQMREGAEPAGLLRADDPDGLDILADLVGRD